jgi:DNA-binding HxlR family transcriptional regulator
MSVARALELVGERWALLVVRDLLLGPKRYGELRKGLPKVPSNILAARLKELEHAGVIRRCLLPQGGSAVAYELTEYGRALDPILVSLGGWSAIPRRTAR